MLKLYSPLRVLKVFLFLLSLFLIIKKKKSFLFIKPLKPVNLKNTILDLGASFIKLAQVLATRADFFDESYLEQLKQLHDDIPSMSFENFQAVYERNFTSQTFSTFEQNPIASASIGQVHKAVLHDGTIVAVKLRRVGIESRVKADIKIINFFNSLFQPFFSFYTKNSIDAVISEFSKMILEEVNLTTELNNLKQFSQAYINSGIHFPKPYEEYCTNEVIVMSFESGFRFDDKENIFKHKIDFKAIIAKLVEFYTTQMLINGYFHADPHPGNILITQKGEIVFLDFGMVKTVPEDKRIAIIELIKAANEKDYETYISASKKLGTIGYEAPVSELAQFTSKMFDIFSNDNLDSESMQKLAFEVLQTTRDFPFKLPSDAIYILRVSAIVEGLGTTYIENFNGVKDILPILQQNIPRALGAQDSIAKTFKGYLSDLPFMVKNFKTVLHKGSEGTLEVEISKTQLEWLSKELKSYGSKVLNGFAFMIAGFFIIAVDSSLKGLAIILFSIGFFKVIYK
ncbi:MAG: AarF/ABC1/UbiB kinase family protein [Campylobacterales bacterium]|nr:AarF/ABC1/UbiB kinase family protein [Campylobacterales bacterium]